MNPTLVQSATAALAFLAGALFVFAFCRAASKPMPPVDVKADKFCPRCNYWWGRSDNVTTMLLTRPEWDCGVELCPWCARTRKENVKI